MTARKMAPPHFRHAVFSSGIDWRRAVSDGVVTDALASRIMHMIDCTQHGAWSFNVPKDVTEAEYMAMDRIIAWVTSSGGMQ